MVTPKRLPEVLTEDERERLLQQPNPKAPTGLRNLCMLQLMLNVGLRVSEVLNLKVRDIDWLRGKLMVREGKGAKDRALWLSVEDLELLGQWRERRPVQSELLFTTLQGKPINDRYVRALVKRLAKKAGIDKDIHPHTLRHTFATDLYRDSKNILMVQKALGHSDLSSTMIYTHIVDDEMEDTLRTFGQKRSM
jgi:site-specific recombinase XerD